MITTLVAPDVIPAHWTGRPWNTVDHRHILGDGRELRAGELITVVWCDRTGVIRAEVSVVLVPEHADAAVREARDFATFAAAREWAEETDAALQDMLDELPYGVDILEALAR